MSEKNKLIPGLPSGFEDRRNKKLILKKRLLKVIENNFIKLRLTTNLFNLIIFIVDFFRQKK